MLMRICAVIIAVLTLGGCASEPTIIRTDRPEAIVLKQDVTWGPEGGPWNPFRRRITLPAGTYRFAWEDKTVWYYENTERKIVVDAGPNRIREAFGALELSKRHPHLFVSQYVGDGDVRNDGAGELVVLMLPKREGKRVSPEGSVGGEVWQHLEFVGSVPLAPATQ